MDREKVIKGLECCLTFDSPCGDCPYYTYEDIQELDCERNLRHDALSLLKEQKADVMCADCRWWHESKTFKGYGDCGQANGKTLKPSNWYCADGKRR
jgi:hypothetical protein